MLEQWSPAFSPDRPIIRGARGVARRAWLTWEPAASVGGVWRDEGDRFVLKIDLSGFRRRDVSLQLRSGELFIRAYRERKLFADRVDSFEERVTLPSGADHGHVDARWSRGNLTVSVAKRREAIRRTIPIVVRDGSGAIVNAPASEPRQSLWDRVRAFFAGARPRT